MRSADAPSAILTYHSIDESGSVISTSARNFERHMESLASNSVPVVPLNQILQRSGSVALTFDDGFRNFSTTAAPVLDRHGFPATVFVVSGFCGRDNQWPGQSVRVPVLPLMDWGELSELAARGYEIGAHTVSHPDLCGLPTGHALREMTSCKEDIEQRLSRPVSQFAYPYGRVPQEVHPPFELACGTRVSYVRPGADPLRLPRLDAFYLRTGPSPASVFAAHARVYWRTRGMLRTIRQWLSQ